jgi:hypothetical protein
VQDSEDDDMGGDKVRKEMQDGLEHRHVRMVQPDEATHQRLIAQLRDISKKKKIAPSVKIEAIEDVYKTKWWTCERMREMWKYVKDDATRLKTLGGRSNMYRRCIDPEQLDEMINQIGNEVQRVKLRGKVEKWNNEGNSRAAVHGAIVHEEIDRPVFAAREHDQADDEGHDEQGEQEGASQKVLSLAEAGIMEASGSGGGTPKSKAESEQNHAVIEQDDPNNRTGSLAIKNRGMFGEKWVLTVCSASGTEGLPFPYLQVKGKKKINLLAFNVEPFDVLGETVAAEAEGELAPPKILRCISLTWNDMGWPPPEKRLEFQAQTQEDRDEWVHFLQYICEKFPPMEPLPDGSKKVSFDGALKFKIGTSMLTPWHNLDCLLYCLSVGEVTAPEVAPMLKRIQQTTEGIVCEALMLLNSHTSRTELEVPSDRLVRQTAILWATGKCLRHLQCCSCFRKVAWRRPRSYWERWRGVRRISFAHSLTRSQSISSGKD